MVVFALVNEAYALTERVLDLDGPAGRIRLQPSRRLAAGGRVVGAFGSVHMPEVPGWIEKVEGVGWAHSGT